MADKFVKLAQLGTFLKNLKNIFVQKDGSKVLSDNNYTTAEKNKLAGISPNANAYTLPTASTSVLGGVKIGTNVAISDGAISVDLSGKVDKISGKGLSSNDYTTSEKTKLAGLSNYTLPIASASALGGIKIGSNLSISADGVLSATQGAVDLSAYAKKATTLAGYGIADAKISNGTITLGAASIKPLTAHQSLADYAKTVDIASTYATKASVPTKTSQITNDSNFVSSDTLENYALKSDVASAVIYKGSVDNYSDLPSTGVQVGWMYNIVNADSSHGINAGDNVVYNGNTWDNYNGLIIIDSATDAEINELFNA